MKKTKPFKLIIISGRRWFQRTYGNTYHTVTVEIRHAKKETVYLESSQRYGYGDQYRQTAEELLIKAGYFKDSEDFFNQSIRTNRDKFVFTMQDVPREKDL